MNAFPCKFSALKGAWKRKGPGARLDGWLWRDCARGGDSQIQEVLETPQTNTKQLHPPAIKKKIVLSLFSSYFKCPRDTNHINSHTAKSFLNTNWFQASLGVCDDEHMCYETQALVCGHISCMFSSVKLPYFRLLCYCDPSKTQCAAQHFWKTIPGLLVYTHSFTLAHLLCRWKQKSASYS